MDDDGGGGTGRGPEREGAGGQSHLRQLRPRPGAGDQEHRQNLPF